MWKKVPTLWFILKPGAKKYLGKKFSKCKKKQKS